MSELHVDSCDERDSFSAKQSECGGYCEIKVAGGGVSFLVKLDREETFKLAVTLNLMAAQLHEVAK